MREGGGTIFIDNQTTEISYRKMPSNAGIFANSKNVEYFSFTTDFKGDLNKSVLVAYILTWDASGWPVINYNYPLVTEPKVVPPTSKSPTTANTTTDTTGKATTLVDKPASQKTAEDTANSITSSATLLLSATLAMM